MKLYHSTAREHLADISAQGLRAGTYLTSCERIAAYYRETIEEEGLTPVTLEIDLQSLDRSKLRPDIPSIEEPLTYTLGTTEKEVWKLWKGSKKNWQASLEIVQSLRYDGQIAPELIVGLVENCEPHPALEL